MHTLIVGARQVGKSTLIRRILNEIGRPVYGFETRKEDDLADDVHGSPVYIYPAWQEHVHTQDNLVGYCKDKRPEICHGAFDRFAPRLMSPPDDCMVLLDEIGFMESASAPFCNAIRQLLGGDAPVIAAVKHNDMPFLNEVRAHPNCRVFHITEENRDQLYEEVLAFVRAQLREKEG